MNWVFAGFLKSLNAYYNKAGLYMVDDILPTSDLTQGFGNGSVHLIEDPSIITPPGMPTLSPGFSYRHFRFVESMDSLPSGFIHVDTYDDD